MLWALIIQLVLAAASMASSETFTWDQCLALAREKNPAVQASEKSVQASKYGVKNAQGAYLPRVNGYLRHGRSGSETATSRQSSGSYAAGLNANWNLFSGLADAGRVDQAEATQASAEESLRESRATVSYELAQGFARLVHAQEYVKLADQIVKRREDNLSLVQLRFENGSENKGSLLLSQANLSQARLDALAARNSLITARASLAKAIGKDERDEFFVSGGVPVSAPPPPPASFEGLARQTPDYVRGLASEKSADAGVRVARAGFLPSLDVSAGRERRGPDGFKGTDQWSLEFAISVPLFNGGRDYHSTKSAIENREAAVLSSENRLRDNTLRLSQAYVGYVEAVEKEKVDNGFSEASSTRALIARQKYNNGLISFEDWDGIENDLINRQKNLIQSQRDRVTAEAAWQQAQGNGSL